MKKIIFFLLLMSGFVVQAVIDQEHNVDHNPLTCSFLKDEDSDKQCTECFEFVKNNEKQELKGCKKGIGITCIKIRSLLREFRNPKNNN